MQTRPFRSALLCSTIILCGLGSSAIARPTTPHKPAPRPSTAAHHAPRALDAQAEETMSVTGRSFNGVTNTTPGGGLMPVQTAPRSQSGITRDFILKQSPTSNVQALIANLPGVITASQDAIGLTNDQLSIRGMNQTQIGYVFEGIPIAGPIRYMPHTGTVVDTENLGGVTVSQGSSDISAPVFNAVGGQVTMSEINPSHKAGGLLSLVGGTHSTNKEFIRFETGDIGNTGIRGFFSYSHASWNNWRGEGGATRHHTDEKFVKEWGEGNSISALFSYNWMQSYAYRRPSLAAWQQSGRSFNYPGTYTNGTASYYRLQNNLDNAMTIGAPSHFTLTRHLRLTTTPYYMHTFGPSVWGQNISSQNSYYGTGPAGNLNLPNQLPNGMSTTQAVDPWNQKTSGLNTFLDWTAGHNSLTFGYWYSYTQHEELASFSPVGLNGKPVAPYGHDPIRVANGSILTPYDLNFKQQSHMFYLSDTLKLMNDRLSLTAAFKTTMLSRRGTNLVPGANPYRNEKNYFAPMPQFYASYKLTEKDQVYINGTTSFRAPGSVQVYSQIFDPSSPTAVQQPGNLKSEYAIGEEIGYRHHGFYNIALAAFNYNLTNHQVTSYGYVPGTQNLISQPLNAGGQTIRGLQAELALGNWHNISPYASGQYLYTTTDNDFDAGSDYLPTKGKKAVQAPKFSGSIGLRYDDGHAFGNFSMVYVDSQYTTFMNDQAMHSYVTSNMTLGYRLSNLGALKHPTVQLNFTNLGDNKYLSTPSSATGNALSTKGIYGKTVKGSAPVYVIGGGFAAMFSVSTGF